MRLWSLHPKYLDTKGLLAVWRETLLAQNVLLGNTRGYKHYPQLQRFTQTDSPIDYIGFYLHTITNEAAQRGYKFDTTKIHRNPSTVTPIPVSSEQLAYEFQWLMHKLQARSPELYNKWKNEINVTINETFIIYQGPVESWEVVAHFLSV